MSCRIPFGLCFAGALLAVATIASAQAPANPPPSATATMMANPDMVALAATMARFAKTPDTVGSGKYPALHEVDPTLAEHVVYRPADLAALGKSKLGVVAWGNGGCQIDAAPARLHLAQIASHGYLVIASGKLLSGPGTPPRPAMTPPATGAAPQPMEIEIQTRSASLREAIDWALAENARKDSRYFGRIDPKQVAVSGWSCGGLQALDVAADPRVSAVVIHNSGTFKDGANPIPSMPLNKASLLKLHTPVIYILGGPKDIAYPNGTDNFASIGHVPVLLANLNDAGHGGSFVTDNGGPAAALAVSWLDWQLRGDKVAAQRFVGADCGLCKDPAWTIARKRIPGA